MTSIKLIVLPALVAAVYSAHTSLAATIRVPDEQPSIQAGIDASSSGDTVLVRCGSYREYNISVRPGITLRSETGQSDCVTIDAQELGRALVCPAGPLGLVTEIEGLTITRGWSAGGGAGLDCESATLSVRSCNFAGNHVRLVASGAGGVDLYESSATFTDCLFANNTGPALRAVNSFSIQATRCTFYGNSSHPDDGNAFFLVNTPAVVANCVLAFGIGGPAIDCVGSGLAELRCCDVYGNPGDWVGCIAGQVAFNGNFQLDPLFCRASTGDFNLSDASPCSPDHSPPGCGLIGARPVACSPQVVAPSTWGHVKTRFR